MAQRKAQDPMSQTRYTPKTLGYELFWKDQFKGDNLDPVKWDIRGVGPRALGYVAAGAVKVEDGYLKLYAIKKGDSILISAIVSHNVHWACGPNQRTTRGMQSYLKSVSKGFHKFGLEWTPDKYIFYIDGYKFYEVTIGISNIEEYMILSIELPSDKNDIKNTEFPDVFIVDYVKVYKNKQTEC